MQSTTWPSLVRIVASKSTWAVVAVFLVLLVAANFPLLSSLSYRNQAVLALSNALTSGQPLYLAQAESYANRAIGYNQRMAGPLTYRLGIAYQQMGLNDKAIASYNGALQSGDLSPSMIADLLFRLAMYQMDAGKNEAAANFFQRLLEIDPSKVPLERVAHANVYLGMILGQKRGDLALEREYLERALELLVDPLTIDRYLALITKMEQQEGEAYKQQAMEMAIYANNRQPWNPWTALARCSAHLGLQQFTEATEWCRRAVEISPRNANLRARLGLVYAAQELWEQALAEYEIAAELNPDNRWYFTLVENARREIAAEE